MRKIITLGIMLLFLGMTISSSGYNLETQSTICKFNNPPYVPSNPIPPNGSSNVSLLTCLEWTGGDPYGNIVIYDVYFGVTTPPTKKISNQSLNLYCPPELVLFQDYYWKIVAWNKHGKTEGPIWYFNTNPRPIPNPPTIDGSTRGTVGIKYEYTFYFEDNDCLNGSIYVDWGDGSTNRTAVIEPGTEIKLNHTWHKKDSYMIKARVESIYGVFSPWGYLEVTIPKNKPFNFNYPFISWLSDRFPLLNQLIIRIVERWSI